MSLYNFAHLFPSLSSFFQRPSAKELLRHRFIRNAKKTSYLTELIERLERWRAEGGDRHEQEENDRSDDSDIAGEPDLWDFGTVRGTMRIPGGPNPPGLGLPDSGPAPLTGNGKSSATLMTPQGSNDRFGTGRSNSSAGSGGSSATGTVRMALQPQRPGIPLGQSPSSSSSSTTNNNNHLGGAGRTDPSVHEIGGSTGQVSARDYAAPLVPNNKQRSHVRTGSEIEDYEDEREADRLAGNFGGNDPSNSISASSMGNHSRAVSTPGGAAVSGRRGSRDEDPALLLEDERRRLEKMRLDSRYGGAGGESHQQSSMHQPHARAASSPASRPTSTHDNHLFAPTNNHGRGVSEESVGSIDPRTEEIMRRSTSGNYHHHQQQLQQQPQVQHQQQSSQGAAMDEVFLPVFEQLSLAVSNRPNALQAIASLRASLENAEMIVPGLANAFAGEIFAYMSGTDSENDGIVEEERFNQNHQNHYNGVGSRLYDEEAEEEEERREREEEMERRKLQQQQQQQQRRGY